MNWTQEHDDFTSVVSFHVLLRCPCFFFGGGGGGGPNHRTATELIRKQNETQKLEAISKVSWNIAMWQQGGIIFTVIFWGSFFAAQDFGLPWLNKIPIARWVASFTRRRPQLFSPFLYVGFFRTHHLTDVTIFWKKNKLNCLIEKLETIHI